MARRPATPTTALGQAMQAHRGEKHGDIAASDASIDKSTWYRLERGTHRPSYDTAKQLAAWLGWTTDQVMEAADRQISARNNGA